MYADDAEADPDGEDIEGAGEGIVAFAGLETGLVKIDHDGEAGEEEEQTGDEGVAAVAAVLYEEAEQTQQQGQQVEAVIGFVVFVGGVRHFALVAVEEVVEGGDAADPIAVAWVAEALEVVLFACEIPHEIAQVHPTVLIAEEVFDVIGHRRLCLCVHAGEAAIGIDLAA